MADRHRSILVRRTSGTKCAGIASLKGNGDMIYFLALLIGVVAGLRAMTAPAAVSWAAALG